MVTMPTRHALVSVSPKQDHHVLVFAHRQTTVLGGRLWKGPDGNMEQLPGRLSPIPGSPIACSVAPLPTSTNQLHALVEYQGLEPIFVRSETSATFRVEDFQPQRLLDRREAIIRRLLSGDAQQFALQFTKFEKLTDPTLMASGSALRLRVGELLMNRVARRAAWALAGREFPGSSTLPTDLRNAPDLMEAMFRTALGAFGAGGGPGFDVATFRNAFAAFVCGELALRSLRPDELEFRFAGIPDSAMFFCFAEAALWFRELDIQRPFWEALLPLFVAGSVKFNEWYRFGAVRTRNSYAVPMGTAPPNHPRSQVLNLVTQFERMAIPDLVRTLGDTVADALRDEIGTLQIPTQPWSQTMRTIEYHLLRRDTANPKKFTRLGPSDHAQLRAAILASDPRLTVPYCDDPLEQNTTLQEHVASMLGSQRFFDSENGVPRHLRLKGCDPTDSRYNPKTGDCDPPKDGASVRWQLETRTTPCSQGAPADTQLELITCTPEIP